MLFNNPVYFAFLALVFVAYWALPPRGRTAWLLAVSLVFYGWWDWRLLWTILAAIGVGYVAALAIHAARGRARRGIVAAAMLLEFGMLGVFKYYDFFAGSLAAALGRVGIEAGFPLLRLTLPIGISFFTFQVAAYVVDVHRGAVPVCRDPLRFFAFVSFFPQLVAGPIERAAHLLPQFEAPRRFDATAATDGLRQIAWGLFKKAAVADVLAPVVDAAFAPGSSVAGGALLLALYFFAIQIYCDFSGYSDIAVGSARLLGFSLTQNFRTPYFARDLREFWTRWHISLTTWFRDYVYVPLGGNRGGAARTRANVLAVFAVSGLWHGASWTFLLWGLFHGIVYVLTPSPRGGTREPHAGLRDGIRILATFHLVLAGWVLFRAGTVAGVMNLGRRLTDGPAAVSLASHATALALIALLVAVEWTQRGREHGLDVSGQSAWVRFAATAAVIALIALFGRFAHVPFIYFQF